MSKTKRKNLFYICRMEESELRQAHRLTDQIKDITKQPAKHGLLDALRLYLDKLRAGND
jgi:hypothetical protein